MKIRNLRKNHGGGNLLPRIERPPIDVTCTEQYNMIITVYLECVKHLRVLGSVEAIRTDLWEV